ncbi:unnamed protein product [Toxocara canis]|uniref:Col_cuticle_N domain-containing protein n=1 Tax=Toxocara canis TaxID=6265 RepID=A0A183V4D7_TOXCA|nr:unnamed protein product [Toxocara canis]
MSAQHKIYQFVTALQVACSGLSLLILCLALPLMYNNVQTTIDYVDAELRFCEVNPSFFSFAIFVSHCIVIFIS